MPSAVTSLQVTVLAGLAEQPTAVSAQASLHTGGQGSSSHPWAQAGLRQAAQDTRTRPSSIRRSPVLQGEGTLSRQSPPEGNVL